jgi:hypothetical protein
LVELGNILNCESVPLVKTPTKNNEQGKPACFVSQEGGKPTADINSPPPSRAGSQRASDRRQHRSNSHQQPSMPSSLAGCQRQGSIQSNREGVHSADRSSDPFVELESSTVESASGTGRREGEDRRFSRVEHVPLIDFIFIAQDVGRLVVVALSFRRNAQLSSNLPDMIFRNIL